MLQAHEHLAEAIGADHHGQVLDAVGKHGYAEGEAFGAVDRIDADAREHQSEEQADEAVHDRSAAERNHAGEPEQDDREVLGGIELESERRERMRHRDRRKGGHQTPGQGGEQRPAERLGRLALVRHRIAVPEERHIEWLSRNPEQDRGECSPVGAGDIHRGEQNDRRRDRHAIGERQRQHDTHHQCQPRQHRHEHADNEPDDQSRQVDGLKYGQKARGKLLRDAEHGNFPRSLSGLLWRMRRWRFGRQS